MRSYVLAILTLLVTAGLVIPQSTQALDLYNPNKKYGDEKVEIENPASKCTGKDFQAVRDAALVQAEKDVSKYRDAQGELSGELAKIFNDYIKDIALGWEAMEEPYCGFGAFGSSAAKKSLSKTIGHARTQYLAAVAKLNPKPVSAKVETVSVVSSTVAVATPNTPKAAEPVKIATTTPKAVRKPFSKLVRGTQSTEVKRLQEFLVTQKFLASDLATGYFGAKTEQAIINFQLAKKVISRKTDAGAGLLGPKTLQVLNTF